MQDQAARVVEVVVVRDRLAHVAVLLRGARGVELLQLEPPVDHGLEQVQRPDRVRHHRLVGPVPRLAHVRLRAQMEDVRPVRGGVAELLDEVVDGALVGQVGEVHLHPSAEMTDVVQRPARGGADERVHVGAELDERVGEVRAHEAVRARDERRPARVDVGELPTELGDGVLGPDRVGCHDFGTRA